ncbi:unnamed protein product [Adineta steineri]|uniref:Phosphoinositide phospholipase C n=1 Tax=Adineta steineri TaxID=433720 RepID=A0A818YTH8_9BILA|nr:unnamed protein product [Adineta steineri]
MGNDDKHLVNVLKQLKSGAVLVKRKIDGKKYSRRFFLSEHEDFITYQKKKRHIFGRPHIYNINDIDEVRSGFRAQTFGQLLKNGRIKSTDENRALSIMYNNHRNELHLMANNTQTRDLWAEGIKYLIDRHAQKHQGHLIREENYFRSADTDKSNSLSKRECRRLLSNTLNVEMPDNIFEQLFQKADVSREGLLTQEEFVAFFQLLTQRKDLYEIMQKHTENGSTQSIEKIHMNINELLTFFQTVQNQKIIKHTKTDGSENKIIWEYIETADQVQKLIDEFELNKELREKGLLGLDGFRNMLLSSNFDIANPIYTRQIYQNMTRPLCDYYINTSHNTYLFYGQLSGESNPEAYNRALLTGCRAVELDCYDGSDGQPIVTHGFTLVKPCSFESIIRYMEPNLFKTSPYPVILNIENHCSLTQQGEMARILKEILGDRLVSKETANTQLKTLPSPEDLKYKVVVRSRKSAKATKPNSNIQLEDDDDSVKDPLSQHIKSNLAALFVYLQNVPYRELEYAKSHFSPFHSSSLVENRFEKISRENPSSLILQTTWRIIRTYPAAFRQDSSNANPVDAWNYGIQMAALNYQNEDDIMPLCYGKFLDNGGCGYVLKPNYLINAHETQYDPSNIQSNPDCSQVLTITIISAQFLSRANLTTSDIPDPYVSVSIHGVPCDQQSKKTKVVENNGFDPIWNETFTFKIKYPQMALVYFAVYDCDVFSRDDKLAHFCLPLTVMQTGYRHIHLRANNNDPIHSTIFVRVDIEDVDEEDMIYVRL